MEARINTPAVVGLHGVTVPRFRTIGYWVISAPVLLETTVGAQWDLARIPYVTETLQHLGYPLYLLTIMGIAKVLAIIALLAPRLPRLKEWAYAGIFFVYAGAASSHFAVQDPTDKVVVPIVFAILTLVSWATRPPSRRDPQPLPTIGSLWARRRSTTPSNRETRQATMNSSR
jgi:uncharacterized membrane protein YphA (DoxX/SURF4 family)